jgi:hypothetical protein
MLIPGDVVLSNKWYRAWTANIWHEQNLRLGFDFLGNHCSEEFWDKTMDISKIIILHKREDLCFFIIMM